jgi:penicillin-binding protein 1B
MTVVWVGFDNNQPIGLSGAQAALPIWLAFNKRALASRPDVRFAAPEGLTYVEIDKETGYLATPGCPKTMTEAFLPGTEPQERCPIHGGAPAAVANVLNRLKSFFKRGGG